MPNSRTGTEPFQVLIIQLRLSAHTYLMNYVKWYSGVKVHVTLIFIT